MISIQTGLFPSLYTYNTWFKVTDRDCLLFLLSDVCNSTNLPEVEIISLLEEQLPHYKLRADTIYGYDHDDWLHTPLISPDANIDLTTEQIEETLKYFRKSKMHNLY